ncbi:MAG: tRNA (adenosine(37)-N6)-dimethylallyltransferase MiaA [Planctomycetes bacterium]|nr:tRNA (adenosine(37)-N6)-dimethylallyltransferase MiaA [Planctomycetota bacterium]
MSRNRTAITFILGCTGCGKGAVGRALAQRIDAEIISTDSMKIYRGMDIGTAKPSPAARANVPHHLLDVVDPWEEYSVAQFVGDADRAISQIAGRNRHILCVGGTSLYIKALSEGLFEGPSADPEIRRRLNSEAATSGNQPLHDRLSGIDPDAAQRIHVNDLRRIVRALEVFEITGQAISSLQTQWDTQRTVYDCTFVGLSRDKDNQSRRINARVKKMMSAGLLDEVNALLDLGKPLSSSAKKAVGYAELFDYVKGEVSLEQAVEKIKINSRHLAKSQRTWFKRFRGMHWFELNDTSSVDGVVEKIQEEQAMPWRT